jgi:hypothetical protein
VVERCCKGGGSYISNFEVGLQAYTPDKRTLLQRLFFHVDAKLTFFNGAGQDGWGCNEAHDSFCCQEPYGAFCHCVRVCASPPDIYTSNQVGTSAVAAGSYWEDIIR